MNNAPSLDLFVTNKFLRWVQILRSRITGPAQGFFLLKIRLFFFLRQGQTLGLCKVPRDSIVMDPIKIKMKRCIYVAK